MHFRSLNLFKKNCLSELCLEFSLFSTEMEDHVRNSLTELFQKYGKNQREKIQLEAIIKNLVAEKMNEKSDILPVRMYVDGCYGTYS